MVIHTVILGLSGTTIDCGCVGAVTPFVDVFRSRRVVVEHATVRSTQGVSSRERVRLLASLARVRNQWVQVHGAPPTAADLERMHDELESLRMASAREHGTPIPGFLSVLAALRAQGLHVGATTEASADIVDVLKPTMAARGWRPDALARSDEVPAPRPAPYLNHLVAMRLGSPSVGGCVVVGDEEVEVEAARNAGMWAVGVALTGGDVGLGAAELASLHRDERARLATAGKARLEAAGAHVVVETVADLGTALDVLRRPTMAALKRWQRPR